MQSKLRAIIAIVALVLMPSAASAVTIINCQPCTVSSTTNNVCPKPTGLVVGQLLMVEIIQTGVAGMTMPASWTNPSSISSNNSVCGQSTGNGPAFMYVAWKVATPTEVAASNYSFTWASGFASAGAICAYDFVGYSGGDPIDASGGNKVTCDSNSFAPSTTLTAPSITTNVNNDRVIVFYDSSLQSGASPITGPGSATQRITLSSGSTNNFWQGDYLQASAGATGTKVATQTQNVQYNALQMAILTGGPASGDGSALWPFP